MQKKNGLQSAYNTGVTDGLITGSVLGCLMGLFFGILVMSLCFPAARG